MADYHTPVMLQECMDGLAIKPAGKYIDVTFGGGGHSREILKNLDKNGRLLAFDQDADARNNQPDDTRFDYSDQNFRYLKNQARLMKMIPADGILADLGISSHQIDEPERGFSTRFDALLDMRMDRSAPVTAAQIVNEYDEEELHRIFGLYGEVKNARTLARTLVTARLNKPIGTINDFKQAIRSITPKGKENKYLAQVFQALRIEVNQELEALQEFLEQTVDVLGEGGRLVVMSYHSLEDRMVKNFMATGRFSGGVEKDFFGNDVKPFDVLSCRAVMASEKETLENNRARSARLRIAVKR